MSIFKGYLIKPDQIFLIKCISVNRSGEDWSFEQIEAIKPIAIYLDGYQYHASKEHPRFPSDIQIRNSITQSSRYYHWTITWNDFKESLFNDNDFIGNQLNERDVKNKLIAKHKLFSGLNFDDLHHQNNLSRLIYLLKSPILGFQPELWSALILFNCQHTWLGTCYTPKAVEIAVEQKSLKSLTPENNNPKLFSFLDNIKLNEEASITAFVLPSMFEVKGYSTFKKNKDWDKDNWELFWQFYNLIQFHNITSHDIESLVELETEGTGIQTVLDNFDESLHEIVKLLLDNDIDFNKDLDFDLVEKDLIIAQAELGSFGKEFIINPFDEESAKTFKRKGFKVYSIDNFKIEDVL